LVLKGNVVCQGYWNRPEATAETLRNGWLHSGDLAYCDEDGFYYIVDRKKDMIISGGENVYPAEVEAVIYRYEGVAEACVFGLSDPKWGETPVAAVVRKPGESFGEQDLIDWFDGKLARYKQPKKILFRDELPKTASGKILKRTLKELYS
jgi:fatty-acyl-CoA synthase